MNNRTKTQFKTWQPLPALSTGRMECPPQNSGARASGPQRPGNGGSAVGHTPVVRKTGDSSPTLKFVFTTHD